MDQKIYSEGIEKAKISYVIFENILLVLLLAIGCLGMYTIQIGNIPIVSILYIVFSLFMLVLFLRKHLCTHCYYYGKTCHCGWGVLAAKLYKEKSGDQTLGGILAGVTWAVIMLLPIILMVVAMIFIKGVFFTTMIYLIPFIILVGINGYLHKVDCDQCKMKFTCPGSAAGQS